MSYQLPELPYDCSALEPHYQAEILKVHHAKHDAAYVAGANATMERSREARASGDYAGLVGLEKALAFNVSGHVLHSLFWKNLTGGGGGRPEGELAAAIDEHFGSFEALRAQLSQAAVLVQGCSVGWVPEQGLYRFEGLIRLWGVGCKSDRSRRAKEQAMKKNMGTIDRSFRILVAAGAVAGSGVLGFSTAGGIVLLVVAAVMVATAASGFCPLYSLVGIKTTRAGDAEVGHHRLLHLHRAA